MTETISLTSPYKPSRVIQQLINLIEEKRNTITDSRFSMDIEFVSLDHDPEEDETTFHLFVRCTPSYGFSMPAFIFFMVDGEFQPSSSNTTVRLEQRLHAPRAVATWLYLIFWAVMVVIGTIGVFMMASIASPIISILILTVFIAAMVFYGWIVRRVYTLGKTHIPLLIRQVLEAK